MLDEKVSVDLDIFDSVDFDIFDIPASKICPFKADWRRSNI